MNLKPKEAHLSLKDIKDKIKDPRGQTNSSLTNSYKKILGNSFYKKIHYSTNQPENLKRKRYNQNSRKKNDSQVSEKKKMLLKIFQFYASFGERSNLKFLRSNKFHKMMNDAGIGVDKTSLDILFVAQNKHRANMTFKTFLNMLPKLAFVHNKQTNLTLKEKLDNMIKSNFEPLYQIITENTFMGSLNQIATRPVNFEEIEQIFASLTVLLRIYRASFSTEFHKEDDFDDIEKLKAITLKEFNKFLRDYGIMPSFISEILCVNLLNNITGEIELDWIQKQFSADIPFKDYGFYFTFSRFLLFLLCVNRISILRKAQHREETQSFMDSNNYGESLLLMFNSIQASKGFRNLQERYSVSNASNALVTPRALRTAQSGFFSMKKSNRSRNWDGSQKLFVDENKGLLGAGSINLANSSMTRGMSIRSKSGISLMKNSTSSRRMSRHQSAKRLRSYSSNKTLEKAINFEVQSMQIFEDFSSELHKLFVAYASLGEPDNTTTLKSMKLHKMLKDAGVLAKKGNSISQRPSRNSIRNSAFLYESGIRVEGFINTVDLDFIFVKLTGAKFRREMRKRTRLSAFLGPNILINAPSHNSKRNKVSSIGRSKLEFTTFLKSLEMIAEKIYPNAPIEQSLKKLVEGKLLPLLQDRKIDSTSHGLHHISSLKSMLEDPDVVRILGVLHNNIQDYYTLYSDSMQNMNFSAFLKFFKDFDFFPSLISKKRLSQYFYALASLNGERTREGNANEQTEKEVIDSHLFVESIALVSLFINKNLKEGIVDSLIYGIQKLDNSEGGEKARRRIGLTRGKNGFNWSLMKGLGKFKESLMVKLRSETRSRYGDQSYLKDVDFESVYI